MQNQIDHFLIDKRRRDSVSDHFLVIVKMRSRLVITINQIEIANRFQAVEENESSPEVDEDPNSLWEVIEKTIKEVANKLLGKKKKPKDKPWFDEKYELWF